MYMFAKEKFSLAVYNQMKRKIQLEEEGEILLSLFLFCVKKIDFGRGLTKGEVQILVKYFCSSRLRRLLISLDVCSCVPL